MPVERQTLERLSNDERFGLVWQQLEPHFKDDQDGKRVIGCIVGAARKTLEGRQLLTKIESGIRGWVEAKRHAEKLHEFLVKRPSSLGLVNRRALELIAPLYAFLRAIDTFKVAERDPDPAKLAASFGYSREFRSGAERATVSTFMRLLSEQIHDIFGKPFDEAVALIAAIVLQTDATKHQARSARRPTKRSERLSRKGPRQTPTARQSD